MEDVIIAVEKMDIKRFRDAAKGKLPREIIETIAKAMEKKYFPRIHATFSPDILEFLAEVALRLWNPKEALRLYTLAVKKDPSPERRSRYILFLERIGEKNVLMKIKNYLRETPDEPHLKAVLGVLHVNRGHFKKAIKIADQLEGDEFIEFCKAEIYQKAGLMKEAEACYLKILETNPNNARVMARLALVMHALGKKEKAMELINRALELQDSREILLIKYSLCLEHGIECNEVLEEIKKIDPDNLFFRSYTVLHKIVRGKKSAKELTRLAREFPPGAKETKFPEKLTSNNKSMEKHN